MREHSTMQLPTAAATLVARLTLAAAFIFSGFVKSVDPLGTLYKMEDYLQALGLGGIVPHTVLLVLAVALAGTEFSLGIFMFFSIHRRLTPRLMVAFMAVMTPLTLWLAVANPISDCGCFGDALTLTNWQTFAKNVVLLAAALWVAIHHRQMVRFISRSNQWIVINYTMLFIVVVSMLSLYHLPLFDFRPYHVGADIRKGMEIPEGAEQPQFQTTFILEKDGEQREFTLDDYPDSTWTFVDSRTVQTKEGYVPPIHDFSIQTPEGDDITDDVLYDPGYTFLLVAPYLEQADDSNIDLINELYDYAQEYGYRFICLTASEEKGIERWRNITGADYPFCLSDAITLKTIVRSNPGMVLLRDGKVVRKWNSHDLPDEYELTDRLENIEIGQPSEQSMAQKLLTVVGWFVLPLLILSLADRLWAWSRWVKNIQNKNKITQFFNKRRKKMRKKIVAGNWKMNMNLQDGLALAKELNDTLTAEKPNCDVVICTPFIHLASIAQFLNQDVIGLGAENCADKEKGAYTGEVSAEMVKSTGARYVILGHSERREYYHETPEILKEKVLLALKNGLKVIFCIGETLAEREANKQNEVVKAELEGSVFNLSEEEFKNIVIAYEPIWAIGTGKTATSDQAEEIHAYIRSIIADKYGKNVADETSILYGGSCKASNAPELFAKPDIDGGLIGGASLKAADFKGIIDAWK